METDSQDLNPFIINFFGQVVTITVSLTATDPTGITMPLFYEGILIDQDDEYLYIGKTINEIDQAVKKSQIVHVMVLPEFDVHEELLNQLPIPSRKEDVN